MCINVTVAVQWRLPPSALDRYSGKLENPTMLVTL